MKNFKSFKIEPIQIFQYFSLHIPEIKENDTQFSHPYHLKLQKLLYYSQAWSMVILNKTLFDEDFQAWKSGPVLKSIWDKRDEKINIEIKIPKKVLKLLQEIIEIYGDKSSFYLEILVQNEYPWIKARNNIDFEKFCNNIITKDSMFKFYVNFHSKLLKL